MLKMIGVVLFLAFASISLSMLFRLTRFENTMREDKRDRRSVLFGIIRKSLMMR